MSTPTESEWRVEPNTSHMQQYTWRVSRGGAIHGLYPSKAIAQEIATLLNQRERLALSDADRELLRSMAEDGECLVESCRLIQGLGMTPNFDETPEEYQAQANLLRRLLGSETTTTNTEGTMTKSYRESLWCRFGWHSWAPWEQGTMNWNKSGVPNGSTTIQISRCQCCGMYRQRDI